ncbi:13652_t:CDS:2 [Ambispora leptoticha]|uniref:13652_t:CDS:1 n=1 Tax=Ambispora leptoticha TaxID=144679 RepID=A0A9N9HW29_9GLOM|nr:13652_t:CDS:2 [Ambispora leptoticha]
MNSFFRRNTVVAQKQQSPDDFSDYTNIIASEDDPVVLKEYIGRLYKCMKDKTKSLRSAYAKLDNLNNEILQEQTRVSDIEDENENLREQMRELQAQLAAQEDKFREWQERLVQQANEEREILEEEHEEECVQLDDRILKLEEALATANEEIGSLTLRIRELSDHASETRSRTGTRRSSMDSRFSDASTVLNAVRQYEDDRQQMAEQVIELTQKKYALETELNLLKEEQQDLKRHIRKVKEDNGRLRMENQELKQQIGRRAFIKELEDIDLDD